MGDSVTRETVIETRTVDGVTVEIYELSWKHGGVCFDVYTTGEKGECISDESTNHIPDDDEIRDMLAAKREE